MLRLTRAFIRGELKLMQHVETGAYFYCDATGVISTPQATYATKQSALDVVKPIETRLAQINNEKGTQHVHDT